MKRTKNGYILWPRDDGKYSTLPPIARDIFFWMMKATPFTNGRALQRGKLLTSYKEIAAGTSWMVGARRMRYEKDQIGAAFKTLKKAKMISSKRVGRLISVTLLQYENWQNPSNYENHSENHKEN